MAVPALASTNVLELVRKCKRDSITGRWNACSKLEKIAFNLKEPTANRILALDNIDDILAIDTVAWPELRNDFAHIANADINSEVRAAAQRALVRIATKPGEDLRAKEALD